MDMLGKIPPHSIEAEQSVLGSMLLDKDAIIEVSDILQAEDFYKEGHKEIYRAVMELYKRDEPVDMITLSEELKKKNILENVGGIGYLSDLTDAGIISTNARYYGKIIEEKAILRKLIKASSDILEQGFGSESADRIIEMAEKSIFDISQKKNRDGLEHIKRLIFDAYDRIEKLCESDEEITGISTGFIDLDRKTSGLQKSDLILVAARPSMGKFNKSLPEYCC